MTDDGNLPEAYRNLPGAEIVERGLSDLRGCVRTEEALLVLVAAPRLRGLGIDVPFVELATLAVEHELYELIELRLPRGAHSAYNALIRRIVSFAHAAVIANGSAD